MSGDKRKKSTGILSFFKPVSRELTESERGESVSDIDEHETHESLLAVSSEASAAKVIKPKKRSFQEAWKSDFSWLKPLPPDFTHKFKMVLHHNINIGQRVEVKIGYNVFRGVVKYKGAVTNRRGDWVGVSLEVPGGDNDGMVQGRRYFQCRERHGIFVRASSIRFIPLVRCLYNKYHKVADRSYVEEPLFKSRSLDDEYDDGVSAGIISPRFQDLLQRPVNSMGSPMFGNRQFHPLRHSVSNRIPAATMRRPKTAMSSFRYTTSPIHTEYDIVDEFITSPAIPKTHMPYTALRNQVRRGWDGAHYVREMSVGTGRDSMKFSQWNDISD